MKIVRCIFAAIDVRKQHDNELSWEQIIFNEDEQLWSWFITRDPSSIRMIRDACFALSMSCTDCEESNDDELVPSNKYDDLVKYIEKNYGSYLN